MTTTKSECGSHSVYTMVSNMTTVLDEMKMVCPTCKLDTLKLGDSDKYIRCSNCGTVFPTGEGFLDLLPGEESPGMIHSSDPMKWGWLSRIYNGRLWRRNPLFSNVISGISFANEFRTITDAMDLNGHEMILDLACGPGTYAIPLAEMLDTGFVIGIDLSLSMLENACKQAAKKKQTNVRFIHAGASNLPFLDNTFNNINCCGALHLFGPFLPDLLSNTLRMLRTGGRFTVAAALAPRGRIGKWLAARETKRGGLVYFAVDEFTADLENAGFTDVQCHHAKRFWLIMSAVKP